MHPLHAEARRLAAEETPVTPCRHWPDKLPVIAKGYHGRTLDTTLIDRYFKDGQYSIGVRPVDAGFVIIDEDKAHEPELPETYTVRTPSGGLHRYYRSWQEFGNGKWAPGIDVRSANGYVLVPPSPGYHVLDGREPVDFPDWAAERLNEREERQAEPIEDNPNAGTEAVERAWTWLGNQPEDTDGWIIAAKVVRDFALSKNQATEAWQWWQRDFADQWDDETIEAKLDNALKFGQVEPGRDAPSPGTSQEAFAAALPALPKRKSRFTWSFPDEDEQAPPVEFWDADKMLPKHGLLLLGGGKGQHKTGLAISLSMAAMVEGEAKVVYAVGEGANGVKTLRVPAHAAAHGLGTADLRGRWTTISAVPMVCAGVADIDDFIQTCKDLGANIVVIDTLQTAMAGINTHAPEASAQLTANGLLGRIAKEIDGLVIIPAHLGKDREKGISGHHGFEDAADGVLIAEHNKEAHTINLTCKWMKDGEDGHSVVYGYDPEGVPVPRKLGPAEVKRKVQDQSDESVFELKYRIKSYLERHDIRTWEKGSTDAVMAENLCGPNATDDIVGRMIKTLSDSHRSAKYASLIASRTTRDGKKKEWRWMLNPS
jgi:hypothetical protein